MPHSKEEIRSRLAEFIQRYQRHKSEGKLDKLVEENTKDYIDELFRILGWDIIDEVIKEYGTGKRKRVDYAFHLGGTTKFLLEAKAYREDLEDRYVNQTLQYGYQNNKTWVVLTNLKEIRIYNAKYFDQEEQIRQLFAPIKLENALERFDDLWLLSKEAMEHGLINQVATKYGKVRPREAIDKKIFEDLMEWRSLLTKSISKNNRFDGTPEEAGGRIDEAVQKILDRMVFVRVCEDRGLEEEGMLKWCITQSREEKKYSLSKYLNRQFSKLNGVYNSGLFAEHFSEKLVIDDDVLEKIINHTYVSPDGLQYDFSAIDADILGTVYEQYLGTLLKKTEKRATLKSEKAQRKKMGIYYTPTYIVDYIVKNTLGEKLKECKTPEEVLKIKVLDPACGSGSFLIRAYDEFKHWFESYKAKNGKGGEQTVLSSDDKKGLQTFMDRVLENCIYGVDLDTKAVELAQLNLLLKAAEDRHKLPKLDHTIQNGNSLIDDPVVAGKFAFKWEENFSEVFRQGGFDVVIGNPPYLNVKRGYFENEKQWLENRYETAKGQYDLYRLFWEKAIKVSKDKGHSSFIIPRRAVINENEIALREFVLKHCKIMKIAECGAAFEDASVENVIFVLQKCSNEKERNENVTIGINLSSDSKQEINRVEQKQFLEENNFVFNVAANKIVMKLLRKIESNTKPFSEFFETTRGIEAGKKDVCVSTNKNEFPLLRGEDVSRYSIDFAGVYCKFSTSESAKFKPEALYRVPEKLLIRRVGNSLIATIDKNGFFDLNTIYNAIPKSPISLGLFVAILNSNLMNFWFKQKFVLSEKIFPYVRISQLNQIPIPVSISDSLLKQINQLTEKMLELNVRMIKLGEQKTSEYHRLKEEINRMDVHINELVYEIYNITENEKKAIEESLEQTRA